MAPACNSLATLHRDIYLLYDRPVSIIILGSYEIPVCMAIWIGLYIGVSVIVWALPSPYACHWARSLSGRKKLPEVIVATVFRAWHAITIKKNDERMAAIYMGDAGESDGRKKATKGQVWRNDCFWLGNRGVSIISWPQRPGPSLHLLEILTALVGFCLRFFRKNFSLAVVCFVILLVHISDSWLSLRKYFELGSAAIIVINEGFTKKGKGQMF
jgi:hypothetical protein